MVAENPSDHHIFLSALTGERELLATSNGVTVTTPRGTIQVMDPSAYVRHFGVAPPDSAHGARLAALVFSVSNMRRLAGVFEQGATDFETVMGRVVVGPATAMGAALVFQPA
jgi:hypothetical protein